MHQLTWEIKMIEVVVTQDMLNKAHNKSEEMGRLNNSITKGKGNLAGFLGEQIALQILGGKWSNTYDYDLITPENKKVYVCQAKFGNDRQGEKIEWM